jgi:hypothetical protein
MNEKSSRKLIEIKYEQLFTLEKDLIDTIERMQPLVAASENMKKNMEGILNEIGEISDKYNIEPIEMGNIFSKVYINFSGRS